MSNCNDCLLNQIDGFEAKIAELERENAEMLAMFKEHSLLLDSAMTGDDAKFMATQAYKMVKKVEGE